MRDGEENRCEDDVRVSKSEYKVLSGRNLGNVGKRQDDRGTERVEKHSHRTRSSLTRSVIFLPIDFFQKFE